MILFMVTDHSSPSMGKHVVTFQDDREAAKRAAHPYLLGNPDRYTVSPLTHSGDLVTLAIGGTWIHT